jgi:hypothetical protein
MGQYRLDFFLSLGYVWTRAAAGRAEPQAYRPQRPRGDVLASDGDAAGHGNLGHRILRCRHDRKK